MMRNTILKDNWEICMQSPDENINYESIESATWYKSSMPSQVHDILIENKVIENYGLEGRAEKYSYVAENDWIYKTKFEKSKTSGKMNLIFEGLDTLVDIYLNDHHIAYHNDMYIPLKIDVSDIIKEDNILMLHFHSPYDYIKNYKMKEEWIDKILVRKTLRKAQHDFDGYLGAKPYSTPIGVYRDIILQIVDEAEIVDFDINTKLYNNYKNAKVSIDLNIRTSKEKVKIISSILDNDENVISYIEEEKILKLDTINKEKVELEIVKPSLWWPLGYGNQNLYKVEVKIILGEEEKDILSKNIGFREIVMDKLFSYRINGVKVKLWGGNFAPIEGISHCWNSQRANRILDMAVNANMNILRVWGEGIPYPDELYDEADKRGILLWQDFFGESKMQPDTAEYISLCRAEAEFLVKRLKHHPSILIWCGGNEFIYWAEIDHKGEPIIGKEIFMEHYKEICNRLDKDRYYHENSPYGGEYSNDPLIGDTHGYEHQSNYVPGIRYPVMFSENTRTSSPNINSMKRFLTIEELWPVNYSGQYTYEDKYPLPETWLNRAADFMWMKTGEIEKFYDGKTPEEMIYKLGAAHGLHLKESVERCRRGRPSYDKDGERRCFGHMVWKLNDTWPQIYTSVIDYYLEAYIPYYSLKKAYEPILLSFDIEDSINLWVVNDTKEDIEGMIIFKLFDPNANEYNHMLEEKVSVKSGESVIVMNLDKLGQIPRKKILTAFLYNENNVLIKSKVEYLDIERHLHFSDPNINIEINGEDLILTTDKFAKCIELSGDYLGDEFGWFFDDNYFDLLPLERKTVKILGSHTKGRIRAKTHYSKKEVLAIWER